MKNASKKEIIELASALGAATIQGKAMGPFSLYPVFRGFIDRFGATPELLVETYRTLVGAGGKGLEMAPDYLVRSYKMDPTNRLVLWELFKSHHFTRGIRRPSFPEELKFSQSDVEHEMECVRRIAKKHPDDKLAMTILEWMEVHSVCYHRSTAVPTPTHEIDKLTRPTATRAIKQLLEETDP